MEIATAQSEGPGRPSGGPAEWTRTLPHVSELEASSKKTERSFSQSWVPMAELLSAFGGVMSRIGVIGNDSGVWPKLASPDAPVMTSGWRWTADQADAT